MNKFLPIALLTIMGLVLVYAIQIYKPRVLVFGFFIIMWFAFLGIVMWKAAE